MSSVDEDGKRSWCNVFLYKAASVVIPVMDSESESITITELFG